MPPSLAVFYRDDERAPIGSLLPDHLTSTLHFFARSSPTLHGNVVASGVPSAMKTVNRVTSEEEHWDRRT